MQKIFWKKPTTPKIIMTQKEKTKEKKRTMQKKLPKTQNTMKNMIQKKPKKLNSMMILKKIIEEKK